MSRTRQRKSRVLVHAACFSCALVAFVMAEATRVAAQPAPLPVPTPVPDKAEVRLPDGSQSVGDTATPTMEPVVWLQMEGCTDEEAEVRRLVGIELQADIIGSGSASGQPTVRVVCKAASYRIFVSDRDPARPARVRGLDLRSTGSRARPRFVALAIVEAMTTPPIEAAPVVVAEVPPVPPPVPPRSKNEAGVRAIGRYFPGPSHVNWGAGAWLAHALTKRLDLHVEVDGETGRRAVQLGAISMRAVSAGVGLLYAGNYGAMSWRMGGGFRLGLVQITGESNDPSSVREDSFASPWGGPWVSAAMRSLVGRSVLLEIGAEAGQAIIRSTGYSVPTAPGLPAMGLESVGMEGPWVAFFAGVGVSP